MMRHRVCALNEPDYMTALGIQKEQQKSEGERKRELKWKLAVELAFLMF